MPQDNNQKNIYNFKPEISQSDSSLNEINELKNNDRGFIGQRKRIVDFVYPMVTGSVGDGTVETYQGTSYAVKLADAAAESVYFTYVAPFNLAISSIELVWVADGAGDMDYILQLTSYRDGESLVSDATTNRQVASNGFEKTVFTRIDNIFGKQFGKYTKSGDVLSFKFLRYGTNAADTINADVHILGLRILYL